MPDSNNYITIPYSNDIPASAGLSASELAAMARMAARPSYSLMGGSAWARPPNWVAWVRLSSWSDLVVMAIPSSTRELTTLMTSYA
jgi:hypothetical protein